MSKKKIHVDIDENLKIRLKVLAAKNDVSFTKMITVIIEKHLKENNC